MLMYNFVDTVGKQTSYILPSEALMINGEYIENLIDGYRTLSVSGREALSPEIDTFSVGIRNGSTFKSKKYPARTITVYFQLVANTPEQFREYFNTLAGILDVENAEIIFRDEEDKYFIGTPSFIDKVESGRNAVTGSFEILCADPFKYSVVEYEAEPEDGENLVYIDYNGTYRSFPNVRVDFFDEMAISEDGTTEEELQGFGDCGYVALMNDSGKILQFGNPNETDYEEYPSSQTLTLEKFLKSGSWGLGAKALWALNSGTTISNGITQNGSMGMAAASYQYFKVPDTSGAILDKTATASAPDFNYVVKAKATNRSENSVKLTFTITASLTKNTSYFGHGYGLKASVYVNGAWKSIILKTTTAYWKGRTGHTVSFSVNVDKLEATTVAVTGLKFKVERTDSVGGAAGKLSETKCKDLKINPYKAPVIDSYYLKSTNYGTGSKWHGTTITRTIPADKAGDVGASDFSFSYSQKMSIGDGKFDTQQIGSFQATLVNDSGKIIAGVMIQKSSPGTYANLLFYLNGSLVGSNTVDLSHKNTRFTESRSTKIVKTGKKITFNVCGISRAFKNDKIATAIVTKITFGFGAYGNKSPLEYNGIYWAKFVKNKCENFVDIPNKFTSNDVLKVYCKTAKITLNGESEPSYGALGNDWEEFYLTPGINCIGLTWSSWLDPEFKPTFRVFYREVFL